MTFVSYAQNYEDVMLFRALKGVERGFYIDVGAHGPIHSSVTKAFYERGWRGINLEPIPSLYEQLVIDRPEDINLQIAASSSQGILNFYEVLDDTGLSTTDRATAEQHVSEGKEIRLYSIQTKTLDQICTEHHVETVHFLKIDVEGAEEAVLGGISLEDIRPWLIVVEATEPYSTISTHEKWEHLLINKNYRFSYFDGLNRFYIAEEHLELQQAFTAPPNWSDDFIRYSEWSLRQHVSMIETELKRSACVFEVLDREITKARDHSSELGNALTAANQRIDELGNALTAANQRIVELGNALTAANQSIDELGQQNKRLGIELQSVYNSHSWRVTEPLRRSMQVMRSARRLILRVSQSTVTRCRNGLKQSAGKVVRAVHKHPRAKSAALRIINRLPRLKQQLRAIVSESSQNNGHSVQAEKTAVTLTLTPHAARILEELKRAQKERRS